jgi:solute carrier family 35 (UDP-galactose transporter), member B1
MSENKEQQEEFKSPLFIVLLVSITISIYSFISLFLFTKKEIFLKSHLKFEVKEIDSETFKNLAISSLFRFIASALASSSVIYVGYLSTVILKSCKPIPVILMNVLIGKRSYSLKKYTTIFFICLGTVIFMFYSSNSNSKKTEIFGFFLLICSLLCDGLVSGFQERIKEPDSDQFLYYMNLFTIAYGLIAVIVSSQLIPGIYFFIYYPQILIDTVVFLLLMTIGQEFIYFSVVNYGNLFTSVLTTTRKMITIFLSVILFSHQLNVQQITGIVVVFISIFFDFFFNKNE